MSGQLERVQAIMERSKPVQPPICDGAQLSPAHIEAIDEERKAVCANVLVDKFGPFTSCRQRDPERWMSQCSTEMVIFLQCAIAARQTNRERWADFCLHPDTADRSELGHIVSMLDPMNGDRARRSAALAFYTLWLAEKYGVLSLDPIAPFWTVNPTTYSVGRRGRGTHVITFQCSRGFWSVEERRVFSAWQRVCPRLAFKGISDSSLAELMRLDVESTCREQKRILYVLSHLFKTCNVPVSTSVERGAIVVEHDFVQNATMAVTLDVRVTGPAMFHVLDCLFSVGNVSAPRNYLGRIAQYYADCMRGVESARESTVVHHPAIAQVLQEVGLQIGEAHFTLHEDSLNTRMPVACAESTVVSVDNAMAQVPDLPTTPVSAFRSMTAASPSTSIATTDASVPEPERTPADALDDSPNSSGPNYTDSLEVSLTLCEDERVVTFSNSSPPSLTVEYFDDGLYTSAPVDPGLSDSRQRPASPPRQTSKRYSPERPSSRCAIC